MNLQRINPVPRNWYKDHLNDEDEELDMEAAVAELNFIQGE